MAARKKKKVKNTHLENRKNKKNIKERVRNLSFRIIDEGQEYARLYEKTYYEEIINLCQRRIEGIDAYHENIRKISNND